MNFIKNNKVVSLLGVVCLFFVALNIFQSSENSKSNRFGSIYDLKISRNFSQRIDKDEEARAIVNLANAKNGMLKEIMYKSSSDEDYERHSLHSTLNIGDEYEKDDLLEEGSKRLLKDSNASLFSKLSISDDKQSKAKERRQHPKGYSEYTIKSGDTLTGIWLKIGGTREGSLEAAKAFKKANVSLSSLRVGEVLGVYKRRGRIRKIERKMPLGKKLTLTLNRDGSYNSFLYEPKIVEETKIVTGKIDSCLVVEAKKLGIPAAIIDQYVDLFSGKVAFRSALKKGDIFTIKYTEKRIKDTGEFLSSGKIQSASIVNGGKFVAMVGYQGQSGKMNYYDENGEVAGNYMLRYPLKFTRISSVFRKERFHPILKRNRPHNGVDFAAPTGTPVRTVADGIVEVAGWRGGAGNMIQIRHNSKYKTVYMHLSKIMPGVKVGARVSRGEHIGNVGSTGLSTGPHLHYGFFVNNVFVDPLTVDLPSMPVGGDQIPANYLKNAISELKTKTQILASKEDNKKENA